MADRPCLHALGERCGILASYERADGQQQLTSDATRVALLAAMGFDACTEANADRALEEIRSSEDSLALDPVRVVAEGSASVVRLPVRLPGGISGRVEWEIELREENGIVHEDAGTSLADHGALVIPVPDAATLPCGYHRIRSAGRSGEVEFEGEQTLILTPQTCLTVEEVLGDRRAFGIWTHLYSVRSGRNWGMGDLGDLRDLVRWAAEIKADFVGLNPLHVLSNRGSRINPYFPLSRMFRNPLYLDVLSIPELADCRNSRKRIASRALRKELERLRAESQIDYESVMSLKRPILEALYRVFAARHRDRGTERGCAYAEFVEEQGSPLTDFATFAALQDRFERGARDSRGWRDWPAEYRDPGSSAVRDFRRSHGEEIGLHMYLQFELDRQLEAGQREACEAGLAVGVYHDLALGSAPHGCDTWTFPRLLARGATLGAPPDAYSRVGQDWKLAPVIPQRLRADRYRYWISLLRHAFRHAGALRIDHVMGLVRQFWVPDGELPTSGAYVRYPEQDLFGILALESRRNGSLVIGEDLGTVPEGFRDTLWRWGVLRSQVLYFERDSDGAFRPASEYSPRAMVTANTHDLPTVAGFWEGYDLELRRETEQIETDDELRTAQAARAQERRELLDQLRRHEIVSPDWEPSSGEGLCGAVHAFLSQTPAALLGVSLDDLGGEREAVNLPGNYSGSRRNWSRRMRRSLEELSLDPGVQGALAGVRERRHSDP